MASTDASEHCRLVVLCSGSGTNLQAIIDAIAAGTVPNSKIERVIVNRKNAFAVQRAERAGIPTKYFNQKGEKDEAKLREGRARYDAALAEIVLQDRPDLIVLAGWMAIFTSSFLRPLDAAGVPVINLHPALPGAYDGANAIGRAYDDFKAGKLKNNRTGAMIHYVIEAVDRGEPILVEEVEVRESDSLASLEERMHSVEHQIIVKATAKVVQEILAKKKQH
ncbi:phosphoribosylglycinamide formyltransferase [Colletotrichum tofieldiae]|uniref:Phosphoribosylglycinamide formyltransferase n=1 Tax=Colletotrichum liriopes TaxID=708192 RepID=A0AA37GVM2_9PEZI|nr:phosphoribosylglycinamide formyltransferase [Colletotrichum liriopes]GKT63642.1 phosphoribosylglycinamide formyltransferase [Colletotrichum tofieldiae]GKT89826.1 phosphoribosylglycinamide formyltransferase [Colletotrichum tofieldiae]